MCFQMGFRVHCSSGKLSDGKDDLEDLAQECMLHHFLELDAMCV